MVFQLKRQTQAAHARRKAKRVPCALRKQSDCTLSITTSNRQTQTPTQSHAAVENMLAKVQDCPTGNSATGAVKQNEGAQVLAQGAAQADTYPCLADTRQQNADVLCSVCRRFYVSLCGTDPNLCTGSAANRTCCFKQRLLQLVQFGTATARIMLKHLLYQGKWVCRH